MTLISDSGAVRDPNEIAGSTEGYEDRLGERNVPTWSTDAPVDGVDPLADTVSSEELDQLLLPPEDQYTPDEEAEAELHNLTVSLSASVEQLQNLYSEVTANGHISRSEASMIKNLVASAESIQGFFERNPVSSFTEMSSKVNYNATCEGLVGSVVEMIIKIVKGVISVLKSLGEAIMRAMFGTGKKLDEAKRADPAVTKVFDKAKADGKPNSNVPTSSPVTGAGISPDAGEPAFANQIHTRKNLLSEMMLNGTVFSTTTNKTIDASFDLLVDAVPEITNAVKNLASDWDALMEGKSIGAIQYPSASSKFGQAVYQATKPSDISRKEHYAAKRSDEIYFHALMNAGAFEDGVIRAAAANATTSYTVGDMDRIRDFILKNPVDKYRKGIDAYAGLLAAQQVLSKKVTADSLLLKSGRINLTPENADKSHEIIECSTRIYWFIFNISKALTSISNQRAEFSSKLWMYSKGF